MSDLPLGCVRVKSGPLQADWICAVETVWLSRDLVNSTEFLSL